MVIPRAYKTLADLPPHLTPVEVRCRRCDRHGRLRLARLIAEPGPDAGGRGRNAPAMATAGENTG